MKGTNDDKLSEESYEKIEALESRKKSLLATHASRESIEEKLKSGGKITAGDREKFQKELFKSDEFLDMMTGENSEATIDKLEGVGQTRRSLLKGLDERKTELEEEQKGASNERKSEITEQLEAIQKAKAGVQDHFGGDGEGGLFGLLRDLLEKFDEFIGKFNRTDTSGKTG